MSSFKKFTCKGTLRQVFLYEAPSPPMSMTPYSPPPLHTVYVYTVRYTYSHREGGRGGDKSERRV